MKKIIFLILFLLILVIVGMAYFEIGFFALIPEPKDTPEKLSKDIEDDIVRRRGAAYNSHIDGPIHVTPQNTSIPFSYALIPLVEQQVAEENIIYRNCLNCEFNEDNPELCEDNPCSPLGIPTNELNYFFCNNPYITGWDPNTLTIEHLPTNIPSTITQDNDHYYKIWRCLDTYKKDLILNNRTCNELLDKTREENINLLNGFISSLPAITGNILRAARSRPTDSVNGIPNVCTTVEDYIFNNRYIQEFTEGWDGFTDDYGIELEEIQERYSNPEVDSIFDTCFAIYNAPGPTQSNESCEPNPSPNISCPLDEIGHSFGTIAPQPPIPTPGYIYGPLDTVCETTKLIDNIEECATGVQDISYLSETPTLMNINNFPRGCGLINGDQIIFNNSGNSIPNPSIAPLCRR